ncbi:MAG: hypothetical protein BMS9Abin26_1083 [Gammaproteobacteria bacterium]|nr:MAG: hypothetical protein BMS9Abin26_1083 [Gammaproteobacteria bacterium]
MTIDTNVDPGTGIITYSVTGCPSYEEFLAAIASRFEHPDFRLDMNVLWDLREANFTTLETSTLRQIAEFIKLKYDSHYAEHKAALVASKNLEYGLCRVYAVYANILPSQIRVFRTLEDAHGWFGISQEG